MVDTFTPTLNFGPFSFGSMAPDSPGKAFGTIRRASNGFAFNFKTKSYVMDGAPSAFPAVYTRTGIQGTFSTTKEVEFFAANVPPINDRGLNSYVNVENFLLNAGSSIDLITQGVAVTAQVYTLSFVGTGTITLSGASTAGPLVGTGASNRVVLVFTPGAGTLTCTVSGSCKYAVLSAGNFPDGGPIITTAGTSMALGFPTATQSPYIIASQDQIFEGAFDYPLAQATRGIWGLPGTSNQVRVRTNGGSYQLIVQIAGASTTASIGATTAGRNSIIMRQINGTWSLHVRVGGATVRSGEISSGIPVGPLAVDLQSFAPFDGYIVFLGHRIGTFNDAAVDARLLQLEAL